MALELKLVEAFVIEHTEFQCQAAKCPDEPELRGDAIYNETEPDVCRELKTGLGFALHLSQRVSGREKICIQDVTAIRGIGEGTRHCRRGGTAPLEPSSCFDVVGLR